MRKLLTFKKILVAAVVLLAVAQVISWCQLNRANHKINDDRFASQLTLNELDNAMQQTALSPITGANRLYLAELNLTLPLNATTSSIRYTYNPGAQSTSTGEARLSSTLVTDHTPHVKSCSDMVRLKIEPKPNPYSPEQPLYTTVHLADGRTLQVYASTTKECQLAWQTVSPQSIAATFKSVATY